MIDFEPDSIEEADREARLSNESNHFKKRKINGYDGGERAKDDAAIKDYLYRRYDYGEDTHTDE